VTPADFYQTVYKDMLTRATTEFKPVFVKTMTARFVYNALEAKWETLCEQLQGLVDGDPFDTLNEIIAVCLRLTAFTNISHGELLVEADRIMKSKMDSYAGTEDFSANFKRTADRCDVNPWVVWLVFADKHLGAIRSWCKDSTVESEPITGRLADLINYCLLLGGMLKEGVV
jgi:hypothetical protein